MPNESVMMQMSLKKTCFAVPPSFVEFQKVGLLEQGRGGDAQHLQTRSHGWWIQNITKTNNNNKKNDHNNEKDNNNNNEGGLMTPENKNNFYWKHTSAEQFLP